MQVESCQYMLWHRNYIYIIKISLRAFKECPLSPNRKKNIKSSRQISESSGHSSIEAGFQGNSPWLEMAAVVGHYNFWNITSEQALQEAWLGLENVKPLSATSAVLSIVMSPIIVFGNVLVLLAVWKDPLKKLRSSPSNVILISMAIADLLVGLAVCPITAYWGWVIFVDDRSPFDLSVIFAINVFSVNVSFGHMFLLTVDRVFAVVTPLSYRVKVTNKRVLIANCACWIYFLVFGCAFLMLRDFFAIMGAVYNVQLLFILLSMLIMYVVIMFRFHRYSKRRQEMDHSLRHRQIILQRERNLFKAISTVICAFLICYMPWFIVQMLIYVCRPCHPNLSLLMIFFGFSGSLTYANSGLNPMLYAWRLPKYKDTFKYFWKELARSCHREEKDDNDPSVCDTRLWQAQLTVIVANSVKATVNRRKHEIEKYVNLPYFFLYCQNWNCGLLLNNM